MFTKEKLKLFICLSALLAQVSFAQQGSVNGPVTTGPLNPASGSQVIKLLQVQEAQQICYGEMLKDMLEPFLKLSMLSPQEILMSDEWILPNEWVEFWDRLYFVYSFDLSRIDTDYSRSLKTQGYTQFGVRILADKHGLLGERRDFNLNPIASITILSGKKELGYLSGLGLPGIDYSNKSHLQNIYDPITHVITGTISVLTSSSLTGFYVMPTKHGYTNLPSNPTQIVLKNAVDESNSNFSINGTKFFQCIESRL